MTGEPAPLVLVVDDEPGIVRAVGAALAARGYRVATAAAGHEALVQAADRAPAVVVLDLGLPDIDGVEVCRRLRRWSDVPVIVLTADGTDERKVEALDEGADDYVTKPFSTPELLARVRVALRHRRAAAGNDEPPGVFEVGALVVDVPAHQARVGERTLELTPKEFAFLAALARHPGRVLTHRAILQQVWGPGYGTETQYLRVYAAQLRRKLAAMGSAPMVETAPGVGYRLVDRS